MKSNPRTTLPIEFFPIRWAKHLPSVLGSVDYFVESAEHRSRPREWLGIVSSSVRKDGYASQQWQDSLHSALQLALKQGWGVQFAHGTPYAQLILHACRRVALPTRMVVAIELRSDRSRFNTNLGPMHVPNKMDTLFLEFKPTSKRCDIPIHDSAVVFLSENLFVLELNEGGKIERLLDKRLLCAQVPPGSTYVALPTSSNANANSRMPRIDWLERGAVGWLNCNSNAPDFQVVQPVSTKQEFGTYQPIIPVHMLHASANKYLVHCTRSRRGPWPDQSLDQFRDELLCRPWKKQPTVLDTLQRILQQQRLIATDHCRRGSEATVCFSGNEIRKLLSMRKFQSHLARWDWEPYGIMIDRDWLVQYGAKQVSYIDRTEAKNRTREDLTYCQVVNTDSGQTNWQEEKEWRVAGDMRLGVVPFSKAIVFVSTRAEALSIQSISHWPIVTTSE